MKAMTVRDRVIRYLVARGWEKEEPYTTRMRFRLDGRTYFVGKAGGVRVSSKGTVTGSVSVTKAVHRLMAKWEEGEE